MLVLTRKINEVVVITFPDGAEVKVKLLRIISDGKVRLGVEAPRDVTIMREEIAE